MNRALVLRSESQQDTRFGKDSSSFIRAQLYIGLYIPGYMNIYAAEERSPSFHVSAFSHVQRAAGERHMQARDAC